MAPDGSSIGQDEFGVRLARKAHVDVSQISQEHALASGVVAIVAAVEHPQPLFVEDAVRVAQVVQDRTADVGRVVPAGGGQSGEEEPLIPRPEPAGIRGIAGRPFQHQPLGVENPGLRRAEELYPLEKPLPGVQGSGFVQAGGKDLEQLVGDGVPAAHVRLHTTIQLNTDRLHCSVPHCV